MEMMNMDDVRGLLCSCECEIPIRYIHPHMTLTTGEITDIRDESLRGLIARKKLQLVLDLDHTLIHSINYSNLTADEKKLVESFDDVYRFTCEASKFVMKLRPGIREFLQEVGSMFDVSVYTTGTRRYAKEVHSLLVSKAGFPKGSWVISKEDSVKPKTKRLDVVLSHERVVLIVDDTENVWGRKCMLNLVRIGRYMFNPMKKGVGVGVSAAGGQDVDTELERVLKILKGVHNEFFYGRFVGDNRDYLTRDVRPMLRWISLNLDGLKPCTIDYKSNEDRRMVCGSSGSVDRQKRARDDGESVDGCVENSLSDVPIRRCNTTVVEGSSSDSEPVLPCNEMQETPNTSVVSLDCTEETRNTSVGCRLIKI